MHGEGQEHPKDISLCTARTVLMMSPCVVTLPFICRGGAIEMEGSCSSLSFVTEVSSGSKLPQVEILRWHRDGRKIKGALQIIGALSCFHDLCVAS